jgi:hypothetical protein
MPHDNPVMFCHDSNTIFYPTGPGRVHMIAIAALADSDGSDEDYSDSTERGDLSDMGAGYTTMPPDILGTQTVGDPVSPGYSPCGWPTTVDDEDDVTGFAAACATGDDFADALEQWADWCDRDSARLDSLDEVKGRIERAA